MMGTTVSGQTQVLCSKGCKGTLSGPGQMGQSKQGRESRANRGVQRTRESWCEGFGADWQLLGPRSAEASIGDRLLWFRPGL